MKPSIIAFMLLASTTLASLAQELSVEDRACITGAIAKLPQVAAFKIEGSRAIEGRVATAVARTAQMERVSRQGGNRCQRSRTKINLCLQLHP
jgi:hypothetical protein